jgi:hypothetical protein
MEGDDVSPTEKELRADAIVRMLAVCESECEGECFYCGGSAIGGPLHDADCPYVLAVAYVEANPA